MPNGRLERPVQRRSQPAISENPYRIVNGAQPESACWIFASVKMTIAGFPIAAVPGHHLSWVTRHGVAMALAFCLAVWALVAKLIFTAAHFLF
jgi:hypothetical protein